MKTFLASFLAVLFALATPLANGHGGDLDKARKARPETVRLAEELTVELLAARSSHSRSPSRARAANLSRLEQVASERHDLMDVLMESDPGAVLRMAVPSGIRVAFPASVQRHLEREVTEEGVLQVIHVDMPGTEPDRYLYLLKTATGERSLRFAGSPTRLLSDSRVRVRGVRLGDSIALATGGEGGSVTTLAAAYPNTFGAQTTLVILVNFSDAPVQPFTPAHVNNVVFNNTSAFDMENSYQQTSLTGTVTPWYTIASTSAGCDYATIATQAKQAAATGGYVLANYKRHVFVFPDNACTWWGLGSVGGNPSQAWIQAAFGFSTFIVAHEMGHNFGLYHSHSLDCGSQIVGSDADCTSTEYGDVFDTMGGTPGLGLGGEKPAAHFNAFQKELLGWLNHGISPPLTTVNQASGPYSIRNLEAVRDTTPRALKVGNTGSSCGLAPQEWYYIEKREAVGFDNFLATTNAPAGVVIHRVTGSDPQSSFLLDMNKADGNWFGVALPAGSSFTDPVTGLVIQPTSVGTGFANVTVTYPAPSCANKPVVSMQPSDVVWRVPGQASVYTVQIANGDSCGCASSAFSVSASVPAGWSASSAQTPVLAPGGSADVQIQVTVPANAVAGFYDVPITTSAIGGSPAKSIAVNAPIAVVIPIELANGVALSPIGASKDEALVYTLVVPPGKDYVSFQSTGGTGDMDMYVSRGGVPTLTTYTCISAGPTTTELCNLPSPLAGTYYVLLHAYSTFSGLSLTGQYAPADPLVPALSIGDVAISEGNAGTKLATFNVSLAPASGTAVAFDVATVPGTASPYGDFVSKAVAGQVIAAGATSSTFAVTVNGDTEVEANETFAVHLSNATGGALIADGQAQGRIGNDDLALLSIADASIVEGNSGVTTARFVVRLSSPTPNPVTFNITTANGSAAGGSDFVARSQSGRYLDAGRTTLAFEVAINGDALAEANETFSVQVSNVSGASLSDGTAVGTIVNDDAAAVAPNSAGTQKLRAPVKRGRARLTR